MRLAEQHVIGRNNKFWKECDRVCFASKNLYNQALYRVREQFNRDQTYKNYNAIGKEMSLENQADYRALPAKVSQQTLIGLDNNFSSFFAALKKYNKNPAAFTGKPKPPKFLHKTEGRFEAVYTIQAIYRSQLAKGFANPSQTKIAIPTKRNVRQLKISPMENGSYKIQIIYLVEDVAPVENDRFAGIDMGLNNLATVVSNCDLEPFIINGKPLKSMNQFYNKKMADLKSELPMLPKRILSKTGTRIQKGKSKKMIQLTHKRNQKIDDYMHKASRTLVQILKQADISKVVIGKNKQWKTGLNIGKENNQKFVSIPHSRFIHMVTYKLKLVGIIVVEREESYTSKCSFLDKESIKKHDTYLGSRTNRGTFRTAKKIKWNADCNGAANILIKEIPDAFANGIEAVVVPPVRVKSNQKHKWNIFPQNV